MRRLGLGTVSSWPPATGRRTSPSSPRSPRSGRTRKMVSKGFFLHWNIPMDTLRYIFFCNIQSWGWTNSTEVKIRKYNFFSAIEKAKSIFVCTGFFSSFFSSSFFPQKPILLNFLLLDLKHVLFLFRYFNLLLLH